MLDSSFLPEYGQRNETVVYQNDLKMKAMNKESLLKKWMKQVYMDEMQLYDVTVNVQNSNNFYNWSKNDPKLKAFHALDRRIKRTEHRIYVHFGFKKGKVWLCEAEYKVKQLFHDFCHEPNILYEMLILRAEAHFEQQTYTLRSWLSNAYDLEKCIYDVPEVLYKPVQGWSKYLNFVWSAFRDRVINMDQLLYEMQAIKTIRNKMSHEPITSDSLVKKSVMDTLKLLNWYMNTLPNSREAHDIAEENRKRIFERNGLEYSKWEFYDELQ